MSPDTLRTILPKLVRWIGALAAILIAGSLIMSFVTTGTVTVTTGSSVANITISSLPQQGASTGNPTIAQKATGQTTVRLKTGSYIVSVEQGSATTNQLVNVGWLSSHDLNLAPSSVATTEPVLYKSVHNLAADSSRLIYIAGDTNTVEFIGTDNHDAPVPGNQYFTSAAWATTTYGLAQDKSGQLYVINGNSFHTLRTPVTGPELAYAIAPDKTIYLGLGANVYRGTESGGFSQISSDFSPHGLLVAATGKVLVINPGSDQQPGTATVITTDGKTTTKKFGYKLTGVTSWSPSGSYISLSVGSYPELFDSSLKQVAVLPQPYPVSVGDWQNDNTLYYSTAGKLWSHNLSSGTSSLIATLPGQRSIQEVSVSADRAYVYLTASDVMNSNNGRPQAVFRVSLHGQPVSSTLSALQDVLPIGTPNYQIGLRNFTAPLTIDVVAYPGVDPGEVEQSAKDTLQGIIDTSNVNFDIEAGD
ncbi:MAG TPA: hypothetical protein VGH44_04190 [Candidatus Saccharimonadia bacterium]|jgi:hypothetical protein